VYQCKNRIQFTNKWILSVVCNDLNMKLWVGEAQAPVEKFERDLGEGRKVRVKDAVPPKDTEVGRLPAPLPYAKATRASVQTEVGSRLGPSLCIA
jgi:hypothetical protein